MFNLLKKISTKKLVVEVKGMKILVPFSVIAKDKSRFEIFEPIKLLFCAEYYDYLNEIFD